MDVTMSFVGILSNPFRRATQFSAEAVRKAPASAGRTWRNEAQIPYRGIESLYGWKVICGLPRNNGVIDNHGFAAPLVHSADVTLNILARRRNPGPPQPLSLRQPLTWKCSSPAPGHTRESLLRLVENFEATN